MKNFNVTFAVVICVCLGVVCAGCAKKMARMDASAARAESMTRAMAPEQAADFRADRMMIWRASLTVEVYDIAEAVNKAVAIAEEFSGYVEYKSDSGEESASLRLRVPADRLKNAVGAVESLGKVKDRTMAGEDVTEQFIDVEARLKNRIELRDRLRQLLAKAVDVKDIVAIETELNRVQSDIDAMEGKIKSLKGQVDYATVNVTFQRQKILGPLGYLFKGLWWGIEKLFIIR